MQQPVAGAPEATAAAAPELRVGAKVCLVKFEECLGSVVSKGTAGGYWGVEFSNDTRNFRTKDLKVLPDAPFAATAAPPSLEERRQLKKMRLAPKTVGVGDQVCVADDQTCKGTIQSKARNGWWAVRFADGVRTVRDVVLWKEEGFVATDGPLTAAAKLLTRASQGPVSRGARVQLLSDSAVRGVVGDFISGGWWAVEFKDKTRNLNTNDMQVLPADGRFTASNAPQNSSEKLLVENAEKKAQHGICVGANICLHINEKARGTVAESLAGGYWSVDFSDGKRSFRLAEMKVVEEGAFIPSLAPCTNKGKADEPPTTMTKLGLGAGTRVSLSKEGAFGVIASHVAAGWWSVQFSDKCANVHVKDLKVVPADSPNFESSQAPITGTAKTLAKRALKIKERGVRPGARVHLISKPKRMGTVAHHAAGGWWSVTFSDGACNVLSTDLKVLAEGAEFAPSLQPPSFRATEALNSCTARRAVHAGAKVRLVSEKAFGVAEEFVGGGCWRVKFANCSRNVQINDMQAVDQDAAFEASNAPKTALEKQMAKKAADDEARGVEKGMRVTLTYDASFKGTVESQTGTGGFWAIKFADKTRYILLKHLTVLPATEDFEASDAPPSAKERNDAARDEERVRRGVQAGAKVALLSDASKRGVVEAKAGGGRWKVRFSDKICNVPSNDLVALPEGPFTASTAPMKSAERRLAAKAAAAGSLDILASASKKRRAVVLDDDGADGAAGADGADGADDADDGDETDDSEGAAPEGCPVCGSQLAATTAVLFDCSHVLCTTCFFDDISRLPASPAALAGAAVECPLCRKEREGGD
ncbi:hypothetical protein M885DRAFT_619979 [Pelagophyceae sp. CCMP2097]|nr:hypothetical protein M885DRAFT_619979 [Pelagophyceae sp. CCMP2097]|mmetsp:Transcript_24838/g.85066  ORF Transcript_24838/g.85066 Transcript_24838/m.85066 type:complete len:817 (-) Transcript_24838:31-2481(-)